MLQRKGRRSELHHCYYLHKTDLSDFRKPRPCLSGVVLSYTYDYMNWNPLNKAISEDDISLYFSILAKYSALSNFARSSGLSTSMSSYGLAASTISTCIPSSCIPSS